VELRYLIRSLAKHRALPEKESVGYLGDEPPRRARPDTTTEGKISHPEQALTAEELETGVKVQGLSEVIATGLRKTTVVVEEPKSTKSEDEEELADPMDVETEGTYIKAFDLDSTHSDAAMREAGDDWNQMDKGKQKSLDKKEFVEKKARQYVQIEKSSYVRTRISEALKSQRAHGPQEGEGQARGSEGASNATAAGGGGRLYSIPHYAGVMARARTHGGAQPIGTSSDGVAEADGGDEPGAHTRGGYPDGE
jgi:hypothetical protein